jgi:hypothetical protein
LRPPRAPFRTARFAFRASFLTLRRTTRFAFLILRTALRAAFLLAILFTTFLAFFFAGFRLGFAGAIGAAGIMGSGGGGGIIGSIMPGEPKPLSVRS